jgi:hypothetical protein
MTTKQAIKRLEKKYKGLTFLTKTISGRIYIGVNSDDLKNYIPHTYEEEYNSAPWADHGCTTRTLLFKLAKEAYINLGVGMTYQDCNDHYLVWK